MSKLVIQDDEGKTTVVPLIREEITIGRKEGNTIRLTERNVSRRHARILRTNGAINIEDLNSYNGVRVNGSRIQGRCQLSVSDRVQIGDYLIELKAEGDEAAAGYDQRTQPIERVDPMATTPVPAAPPQGGVPTAIVNLNHVQGMPPGAAALADTDPGSQAHPGAMPQQFPEGFARVVILSTNFAGREYELNKPAMVIGRTDDNDIVVNHRSISRHHAKIVRENGRYAIVDLQSSNGVRVNGEEYGKVELRRGDVVDLGHVRMRFVDVGEDFVFGRDAHPVEIGGKRGKGMWIALIGAVVLIAVIVAVVAGGDDGKDSGKVAAGDNPEAKGVDTTDQGGGDTAPSVPAKSDTGDSKMAGKLASAREALGKDDWKGALAAADEVLGADPDNAEAKRIQAQAKKEMAAGQRFEQLKRAAKKRQYGKVRELFGGIDAESVYHDKARDVHDALKSNFIKGQVAIAKRMARGKKCDNLRKLATRASRVWPDAGDAVSAVECDDGKVASAKPNKPNKPNKRNGKKNGKPKNNGGGNNASSGKSGPELLAEAKAAARQSQFGKALRLCRQALKKGGGAEARMVCAIAGCNLKQKSIASRYIKGLSGSRKGMARQICLRHGVSVD